MTAIESGATLGADWTVRLECGHRVAVPFAASVPAMAACLVQHQGHCAPELATPDVDLGFSLPIPRGVAFR